MTKVFQEKLKLIPLSGMRKIRKVASLGHAIRAGIRDAKDPMYQVTFEEPTLKHKTTTIEESAAQETNRILTPCKRHRAGPNITQKKTNQNTTEQNNKDLSSKQSQAIGGNLLNLPRTREQT